MGVVFCSYGLVLLFIYHTAVGKSFNYIYFRFLIFKKKRYYLLHMLKALLNKNILSIIFGKLHSDCESLQVRPAQVRSTQKKTLNGRQTNL